ncbi:MAG TPA: Na+:solute symporter, partial [Bacteroidales bacterium]|nr:Na+:solute symporter [Bacteroidales bacterium]
MGNFLTNDIIVDKFSFFPDFTNAQTALTIFLIPITIQWWASWYPGSEPGGGGYLTQRIL